MIFDLGAIKATVLQFDGKDAEVILVSEGAVIVALEQ